MNGLNAEIEKKAYDYFIVRGKSHGGDVEVWLRAEEEILMENGKGIKRGSANKNAAAVPGEIKRRKKVPDVELDVCTKSSDWAGHRRASDPDEPCDDGRGGGI